jgi:hypothetical protein
MVLLVISFGVFIVSVFILTLIKPVFGERLRFASLGCGIGVITFHFALLLYSSFLADIFWGISGSGEDLHSSTATLICNPEVIPDLRCKLYETAFDINLEVKSNVPLSEHEKRIIEKGVDSAKFVLLSSNRAAAKKWNVVYSLPN